VYEIIPTKTLNAFLTPTKCVHVRVFPFS